MSKTTETFKFDLNQLAEPPIYDSGYELLIQIPRSSGRAPKGWKDILDERGLHWRKKEIEGGMMLSVRTTSYEEFLRLHEKFVHGMPWSHEITQWWHRTYRSFELIEFIDTQAAKLERGDSFEIRTPASLVRGVTHSADKMQQYLAMKKDAREEKRQAEARYLEAKRQQPKLPPFEEWQRALDAGEEPRLLLPAPAPIVDEEKLAKARAEAEAEAESEAEERERKEALVEEARRRMYHAGAREENEKAFEKEMAEMDAAAAKFLEAEIKYLFVESDFCDQTFEGVMTFAQQTMNGQPQDRKQVREILKKLLAEGHVRRDADGSFHTTQEDEVDGM